MFNTNIADILTEDTFVFHYVSGGVTPIDLPHTTGWRTINGLTVAQLVNGALNVHIEGKNDQFTEKDGAVLICPEVYHKIDAIYSKQAISRWSVVNYSLFGVVDITSLLSVPAIIDKAFSTDIGDINEELSILYERTPTFSIESYARKMELGFKLLSIISKISPLKENVVVCLKQIQRLIPVLKYIDSNLNIHLNRKDLANLACLSQSRFNIVFKQTMGMTPMEYLKKIRLKKAQMLLSGSDLSISEIAERVGYSDQFHFSRDFKKGCNNNPTQFRKIITKWF